jgi:DNA-binding transcriptional ArsR family regulator
MVQYPTTVDRAFAALADPTRRAVLERLGPGSATISELAEPFGMSLTGMKKHIRLLEDANLVATEKVGRARRCTLVPYAFEGISTWLQRLDRFAQVVERTKDGMSRDLLSSSAEDPRRCSTVELEEAPYDDRNGT